mgnify:CR=1 FL=1
MGVAGPKINRPDPLMRAIQYSLKERAAEELLTEAQYRGLDVKVATEYDINSMALRLRIAWSDPNDKKFARCIEHLVDDDIAKDLGLLADQVNTVVKNISLRGELFFFRLAKHFPKHLKKVECDGNGHLEVEFKNGRRVQVPETEIDDTEFLAKCGMIYDL